MRRLEIVFNLYFKNRRKGLQFQCKGTIESLRSISTNLKVTILSHRFMVDCQIVVRKKKNDELLKESVVLAFKASLQVYLTFPGPTVVV